MEALGLYLAVSHDETVRAALRKAAIYHSYFTYPDGTEVETVDERNPYPPRFVSPTSASPLVPKDAPICCALSAI